MTVPFVEYNLYDSSWAITLSAISCARLELLEEETFGVNRLLLSVIEGMFVVQPIAEIKTISSRIKDIFPITTYNDCLDDKG